MSDPTPSSIDSSFGELRIRRVAGHIGGEVQDIELASDLPQQTIDHLRWRRPRADR